jgi:UDP-glucose 4-epimerase
VAKVLITGGFGFIGGALARHLLSQGHEVAILEHPDSQIPSFAKGLEIVQADITSTESMASAACSQVDAVLHLAGQPSGARSFSIPVDDLRMNALGTLNTAIWCLENDVERIVAASTFNVYGDHPGVEEYPEDLACRPQSVYASSKLAAENMLANYAGPKGIRWSAMRMFNVYGPGQDITRTDQGVVGIFMSQLMNSPIVEVRGSLARFRDLVHIDDVVAGWEKCLFSESSNQPLNLGSGTQTTFLTLIEELAAVVGVSDALEINELDGTPGDMLGCCADLTRIASEVGYEPSVPLDIGLHGMYDWVKQSSPA